MSNIKGFECLKLSGTFEHADAAFAPLIAALRSQAGKIGIEVTAGAESSAANELVITLQEANSIQFTLVVTSPQINGQVCDEVALQALTGLASVHSRSLDRLVPLGVEYISIAGASLVLQQLLAGLIARHRGGRCRKATFDLVQAGLLAVGQYLAGATTEKDAESFPCAQADVTQRPPFISQDGIWFELESLSPPRWQQFWQQMGAEPRQVGQGWHAFMQRYAKGIAPLPADMVALLGKRTYAELESLAQKAGVAITRVRTIEARQDDSDLPELLNSGPCSLTARSSHQHPSQPLAALSPTAELPLSGIRLVESCRRIQGPMAGHLLAMFGADVIRIEPPGGDPLRGMPPLAGDSSARFQALNGLKQITEVDIKSAAGKQQVISLVSQADIFIHNWAPGKAAELGLDAEDLSQHHQDLVYVYAGGWGAADEQMTIPGTDFMAQAYSGMADVISRCSGVKGGTLFTATDVLGGILAAQATIMALYCRVKGASGLNAGSSLLGAATLLTEPLLHNASAQDAAPEMANMPLLPDWCCTDLKTLSSHPLTEPYLMTGSYTRLHKLWRPL